VRPLRRCRRGFTKGTSEAVSLKNELPGRAKASVRASGRLSRPTFKGRWFFVYGFAKSERDNIEIDEVAALKELATELLNMPPQSRALAIQAGELTEIDCDA
jgi:hypothetical protein